MRVHLLGLLGALATIVPAQAQYTAKEWPEGPMKQRFAETCGGCHDINRIRVGYTPEGWLTVVAHDAEHGRADPGAGVGRRCRNI